MGGGGLVAGTYFWRVQAVGAIQVCITMTNLMLGWIGEPAMSEVLHIVLGPLAAQTYGLPSLA